MDFELTSARRATSAQVDFKSDASRKASRRSTGYPEDLDDGLDIIREIRLGGYVFLLPVLI